MPLIQQWDGQCPTALLRESKSVVVSEVIAATVEAGLIKAEDEATSSRKFARHIPFWA